MMKLRIEIDCGNAAFCNRDGEPDPGPELARILRQLADRLEDEAPVNVRLHDINGNACGVAGMVR